MRTANKYSYFGNAARRPRSPVLAMGGHADRTRRADENRRPASNLHYALVAVAAALVYLNSLDGGFAYDDSRAIKTNQDLHWHTPLRSLFANDFWGTPLAHSGSHKSYRPICVLSFRVNYFFHQLDPWGYHLVNVLLHVAVSTLFTRFAAELFNADGRPALIAGLLFAIHPVHTEAVAGIVGRADCGAALFFLLSLMAYMRFCQLRNRSYLYASLLMAVLAMLSKEHGITVIAVSAVYHALVRHKFWPSFASLRALAKEKRLSSLREGLLHLIAGGALIIGLRLQLMGLRPPDFAPADNPIADASSLLTRTLTFLFLPAFNFYLLLHPRWLSFDWSMEAIPLIHSLLDARNVVSLVFYAMLFFVLRSVARATQVATALDATSASSALPLLPCACHSTKHSRHALHSRPVTNNNNNSLCVCNESSASSSWTCSSSCSSWDADEVGSSCSSSGSSQSKRSMSQTHYSQVDRQIVAVALLVIPFLPATNAFFYVGFVVAERILYIPSMGYCIGVAIGIEALMKRKTSRFITLIALSILLMSFAGRTLRRNIDWSSEEKLYEAGISINPPKAYGNLANILSAQGKKHEAELAYRKALSYRSNMADVHYNLGILLQEQGRLEEALVCYKNAIQFRPRLAMAHLNLGLVLGQLGRKAEAAEVYRHCAALDGNGLKDPKMHESTQISALFNLGRLFADDGHYEDAIIVYRQAIAKMPRHYQSPHSLYNMVGEAYYKLGKYDEAEEWYKQAIKTKADHIPAHLTYAKLLAKMRRPDEAEQLFLKANSIAPNDSSVHQHYGQFLSESERHDEAAEVYIRGIQIAPGDFEMVFNAANALRQAQRNSEAEHFYKDAVRLRPNEVTSHMNLGAMLHVNGKLVEAESSYLEALRLKPDDAITVNNLAKLRHLLQQKRALGR